VLDLADWFAAGERVPITVSGPGGAAQTFGIFCRVEGEGPWLTFLHGFPTCSWDWAPISDALKPHRRLLLFDFLGYGDSDKPHGHAYSIFEQADIAEALWRHFGIAETGLVAHDYGDSVATELLARQAEGRLATRIGAVVMLNGGIYVDVYRPLLIQTLLRRPVIGQALARLITERAFARSFRSLFSPQHPISDEDLHQHWLAIQRRNGAHNYHALIRYIDERHAQRDRWEGALERSVPPIHFIWGMLDPVSGAPIARRLRERIPAAAILELTDVGHYPQLEVPDLVASALLRAVGA
jgi:pimeloyl-ACP methyl ester carboxylesterase